MDGQKVTLDQTSLTALASETRIGILKQLDQRPMTTSELSRALDLSKPTILQHLEKLDGARLVTKKEQGKKWIYYQLTSKAKNILHPERVKISFLLSLAVASALGAVLALWRYLAEGAPVYRTLSQDSGAISPEKAVSAAGDPVFLYLALACLAAVAVLSVGAWWLWRRSRPVHTGVSS
ncbi:MAG: winged helix-turn-helix domain-containing protein [Candidatus Thermoplasmatota archaeon]|nr:winged helix-turn-helix domain-containing protein [Candidatus Thermoplasmatota archaeon]MDD5778483.1 winged helix-turn-helix domain-containing protein [Candidatus Thermoplasmatota archaeon]